MPCNVTKLPNGFTAIVCSRGARHGKRYCKCGTYATLVCDWPTPEKKSGTCDNAVCTGCARKDGEKDYCPFHRGRPPMTQAEMDLAGERAADDAARILGVER